MGNACGTSTVGKIVTLGGTRQSNKLKKPKKIKPKANNNRREIDKRRKTKKKERNSPSYEENTRSPKPLKASNLKSSPSPQNDITVKTEAINKQVPSAIETKNANLEKNTSESNDILPTPNKSNNILSTPNKTNYFRGETPSDFSVSSCNSRANVCTSNKQLYEEKFKNEWRKEEKRIQMEYYETERRIKNSQQDEQRAKVEVQTWRKKLEKLTSEHRKYLFKQAQTINSRLQCAEKLLTYHEVRAKKLQIKNDQMKELIYSVKEEAKNLRIESEKRREVTHKIFDEKFSTVEKQLSKLKLKLGQAKTTVSSTKRRNKIGAVPWGKNSNSSRFNFPTCERKKHAGYYSRYFPPNKHHCKHADNWLNDSMAISTNYNESLPSCHPSTSSYTSISIAKPKRNRISCVCGSKMKSSTDTTSLSSLINSKNNKSEDSSSTQLTPKHCTPIWPSCADEPKSFNHKNRSPVHSKVSQNECLSPGLPCFDERTTPHFNRNTPSVNLPKSSQTTGSDRSGFVSSSGSSILMKLFELAESERSSRTSTSSTKFLKNKR